MIISFAISTIAILSTFSHLAVTLGGVGVVALILLLISRELSTAELESGKESRPLKTLSRYVIVPILPLLLVFAVIVAQKVAEVLA